MSQVQTKRPCNKLFNTEMVQPEGGGYEVPVISQLCQAQVPVGTPLAQLDVFCGNCPHRVEGQVIEQPQAQAAMPTTPAMPTPAPEVIQASEPAAQPALEQITDPSYRGPVKAAQAEVWGEVKEFMQHQEHGPIWSVLWAETDQPAWYPAAHLLIPAQIAAAAQPQPVPIQPAPVQPDAGLTSAPLPTELPQETTSTSAFSDIKQNTLVPIPDNILGEEESELADVDALLKQHIPELVSGPSVGGFSSHTLEAAQGGCWFKCYLAHALGLRKNPVAIYRAFGSLYHACKFMHYLSGGVRTLEPCRIVRNIGTQEAMELANAVGRLLYVENQRYGSEEAQRWCIRGLEDQDMFWSEPVKIGGKTVQIPFTCRIDLLFALINPGDSHPDPGSPVPGGVYQGDYKTARQASWDVTRGFIMNPQFLHNNVVYLHGTLQAKHGPLAGVMVHVAIKHKRPDPEKSFFRVYTSHNQDDCLRYYYNEMLPAAVELYGRLANPDIRKDPSAWPQNRHYCNANYACDFRDVCLAGASTDPMKALEQMVAAGRYKVNEDRIINVDALAPPPPEIKRAAIEADPARRAAAQRSKEKAGQRKGMNEAVASLIKQAATEQHWPTAKADNYLTAGHTEASVRKQIAEDLAAGFAAQKGTAFELSDGHLTYNLEIKERGFSWKTVWETEEIVQRGKYKGQKKKERRSGQVTWKQLAETLSSDWWSLDRLTQMGQEPLPVISGPPPA